MLEIGEAAYVVGGRLEDRFLLWSERRLEEPSLDSVEEPREDVPSEDFF